jgi:hypothetical protein
MCVISELYAPAALPPRKETRYPFDRMLSGPRKRSGRNAQEKYLLNIKNRIHILLRMLHFIRLRVRYLLKFNEAKFYIRARRAWPCLVK